jgi:hypothetical protein
MLKGIRYVPLTANQLKAIQLQQQTGDKQNTLKDQMKHLLKTERESSGVFYVQTAKSVKKRSAADGSEDEEFIEPAAKKLDSKASKSLYGQHCSMCLSDASSQATRKFVIAIGLRLYLAVPKDAPLVPGECLLVPAEHYDAVRSLDDDSLDELMIWKRRLVRMFESKGQTPLFMELVTGTYRSGGPRHCFVSCIPIPKDSSVDAPVYFKKAMIDAAAEWSRKEGVLDTHWKTKPLSSVIPKGFPYFHVEFGLEGGFVQVLEEDARLDWNFGKEVICAILDQPAQFLLRKKKSEEQDAQRQRIVSFLKDFDPYDWTKNLD